MIKALFAITFFILSIPTAMAQEIKVSPSSINAYSQGATSALHTYSGVKNKQPVESCWCSEDVTAAPDIGLKSSFKEYSGQKIIHFFLPTNWIDSIFPSSACSLVHLFFPEANACQVLLSEFLSPSISIQRPICRSFIS